MPETEEFFVYENWTTKRGRAHVADCPYCNFGRGTQPEDSGRNGMWHACSDRDASERLLGKLRSKGWTDVKWCARCG